MEETWTCGMGIAQNAALPAALAEVLSAAAENLETHMRTLDPSDEKSKPEYEAYKDLVNRHRNLVSQLQTLANQMLGYREIPMASHDPDIMNSPLILKAFENFVARERDLLTLLQERVIQHTTMLSNFKRVADRG